MSSGKWDRRWTKIGGEVRPALTASPPSQITGSCSQYMNGRRWSTHAADFERDGRPASQVALGIGMIARAAGRKSGDGSCFAEYVHFESRRRDVTRDLPAEDRISEVRFESRLLENDGVAASEIESLARAGWAREVGRSGRDTAVFRPGFPHFLPFGR